MQKMMSCKWHDQVFSFCSESHAAVCIWTTTVHALHCISLAVCNKAICHVIRDLLRWNLKYLLKTTGLISISVSQQQAPNPKENRWLYMQKYHILIHAQERFHITLGRCPEDEHNIIFSVVLWEAHNPNTGTNVQDSSWETATNLFKTRHPVNANNKQSIVIYQNKLHFCVLFYICFFFSVLFLNNFQKHLKTFCLLKNSYWKIFLTLLRYSAEHTKYRNINPPQSICI